MEATTSKAYNSTVEHIAASELFPSTPTKPMDDSNLSFDFTNSPTSDWPQHTCIPSPETLAKSITPKSPNDRDAANVERILDLTLTCLKKRRTQSVEGQDQVAYIWVVVYVISIW